MMRSGTVVTGARYVLAGAVELASASSSRSTCASRYSTRWPCWIAAMPMAWARWLLPVPGGPSKSAVVVLADEAAGGELEDEAAVHLLVEVEVEGIERLAAVAEARLLHAPVEQAVLHGG